MPCRGAIAAKVMHGRRSGDDIANTRYHSLLANLYEGIEVAGYP